MQEAKVLIEEIRAITIQYRAEVGSRRKPWPKSITSRIEKLFDLGWKAPKIAEATGVPYFSILHWRARDKRKFHTIEVARARQLPAATVAVESVQSATESIKVATVTVATPDGYQIKIESIHVGRE